MPFATLGRNWVGDGPSNVQEFVLSSADVRGFSAGVAGAGCGGGTAAPRPGRHGHDGHARGIRPHIRGTLRPFRVCRKVSVFLTRSQWGFISSLLKTIIRNGPFRIGIEILIINNY